MDSTDAAIVFATLGSINRLQVGPCGAVRAEGGGGGAAERRASPRPWQPEGLALRNRRLGRVSDVVDRGERRTDVNRGVLAAYFHQLEDDATRVPRELKQRGESEAIRC